MTQDTRTQETPAAQAGTPTPDAGELTDVELAPVVGGDVVLRPPPVPC
jgi:hypothetical protein